MREFKFFKGITLDPYVRLNWVDIEFDGYRFRIQTHHSSHIIGAQLRNLNRFYMRMGNDDMNRDRILELLRERFANAVNVIDRDELVRNGGYI